MNTAMAQRNNYIDFLRGIATLSIIGIHTAFWGGQSYTPEWFRNITLLLDVPFFFYLSGWASGYRKSDVMKSGRGLLEIWCKWWFFIVVLELMCLLSCFSPVSFEGISDVRDLVNNFMFNVSFPGFPVVAGSIWFMPRYFIVIMVNTIIMTLIQTSPRVDELKKFYMYFLILVFVWVYYGKYTMGLDLAYLSFYGAFWMMGMTRFGKTDSLRKLVISLATVTLGVVLCSYLQNLPVWNLQSAKFPPSLKYGFASMYMILIAMWFDGKYDPKAGILTHIGKNAIFYYFAQGIGSSINYYVVDALHITPWFLKWSITLLINILITIAIAETLAVTYKLLRHKIVNTVKHMAHSEHCVSFLFSLFFVILIILPGTLTVLKLATGKEIDKSLNGNFDPVDSPELNIESFLKKDFQQDFEVYFHNRFTGRGYLITTYNQIRHDLFGENPQSCIGDSLIFEPYITAHLGLKSWNYSSPEPFAAMESYVDKLQNVSDLLKEWGKSLIVVTASGKATWLEEDIPQRYYLMPRGLGAADCLDSLIKNKDILYLNCDRYLTELDFQYPVFYKSSHHWSRTAEIEIEMAILNMINAQTPFETETYGIDAVIESSTPIARDADTLSVMNRWSPTHETYYTYDIHVNNVSESTNICIQGDSFSSMIADDLIHNGHNGRVSRIDYDKAYYENGECISLLEHDFANLDISRVVDENDIFIILFTDYNLPGYSFGFVDALYDYLDSATGGI